MEAFPIFKALEYVGLVLSFIYLWFEFKQRPVMWVFSILCSLTYVCIYIHAKLYADMGFSCFNICISFWGLVQWMKATPSRRDAACRVRRDNAEIATDVTTTEKEKSAVIEYRRFTRREWAQVAVGTVAVYAAIYAILALLTDSPVPARDAFNTTINIVGTWALGRKAIEVWGFWFVANAFSVYLYFIRGLYPTLGLYVFYTAASVYGYWRWRRHGVEMRPDATR